MPGFNQIYYNNEWRNTEPYIYHNGIWRRAFPNIYHNNQWIEMGEISWVLWSADEKVEWQSQYFNNMTYENTSIAVSAITDIKDDCLYFYQENKKDGRWRGNNWSTLDTIYIPKEAKTLKVSFNKGAINTAYARVNIGLILPTETDSFNSIIGVSYTSSLSQAQTYTLSLNLIEDVIGTKDYLVVVNGWMQSDMNTSYHGALYIQKVWFE